MNCYRYLYYIVTPVAIYWNDAAISRLSNNNKYIYSKMYGGGERENVFVYVYLLLVNRQQNCK